MIEPQYTTDIDYSRLTTRDPNLVKRFLQNLRLSHSTRSLKTLNNSFSGNILDFGAGNAELVKRLSEKYRDANFVAYEPERNMFCQAEKNIKDIKNILVTQKLKDVCNYKYDIIFCMEVFEHLPEYKIGESLNIFKDIIDFDGSIIIGVPNELYIAALLKGIFRMTRRFGEIDARPGNILRAALGRRLPERNIIEIDKNLPYISRHIGFDYHRFKKQVEKYFTLQKQHGSPFPVLPLFLNFELYFSCKVNHDVKK